MKKILVVLIVALVVLSSASAFKFKSVGIDTGTNGFYASLDMEIIEKLEVYARVGYSRLFATSAGVNYNVSEFKINGTPVYIKPGAQMGFAFGGSDFMLTILGTCDFAFETSKLTAFLRPSCGLYHTRQNIMGSDYKTDDFVFILEAGVAYLF